MNWLELVLGVFLLVASSQALASCNNSWWNESKFSCQNDYGVVSQDPANLTDFLNYPILEATSFQNGTYDVFLGFDLLNLARPKAAWYWGNKTISEPTFGWVLQSFFLQNVTSFVNFSGNPAPCELGETNEKNKQKFNITNYNSSAFSRVACFKNVTNQTPNYYVNWFVWGVNGSQDVQVEGWKPLSNWGSMIYDGQKWFYILGVSFIENVTRKLLLEIAVDPNAQGKYDILIKPSGKTLQQAIEDGTYLFLDPWYYTNYAYEIEFWVNNPSTTNKINELVVLNASNFSQYCQNAGCYDVRLTTLDNTGAWVAQTVFNASQNYTTETDLKNNTILLPTQPVYWQAPAQNQPLYISTIVNTSAGNNSLSFKLYVGASGVTAWASNTTLYGTSLCDANAYGRNWSNNMAGTYSLCSFTRTGTSITTNFLYVGKAGGFWTANVNASGTDPLWMLLAQSDNLNYWRFSLHTTVPANNMLERVTAGVSTVLATGSINATSNLTGGFAWYPNGTRLLIGYTQAYVVNETSLLRVPMIQVDNDTSQLGYSFGYTLYAAEAETIRNICYLYWDADAGAAGYTGVPREYCRTYFDFGGSSVLVGNYTTSGSPSITANGTNPISPTNWTSTLALRFNVTANATVNMSALLEWNATTNFTMTLVSGNVTNGTWEYNLTGQAAGVWEYQFFVTNVFNTTNNSRQYFTVGKADPKNRLFLNGNEGDTNIAVGTSANATAQVDVGDCSLVLSKDTVPVSNPFLSLLTAATYNFTSSCGATTNFSAQETMYWLTVTSSSGGAGGGGGGGGTTTIIKQVVSPSPLAPSQLAASFSSSFVLAVGLFIAVAIAISLRTRKVSV